MPHDGAGTRLIAIASFTDASENMPRRIAMGSHASGSQHVPAGKPSGSRGQKLVGGLGSGVDASMPAATNAAVLAHTSCTSYVWRYAGRTSVTPSSHVRCGCNPSKVNGVHPCPRITSCCGFAVA